MADKDAEAKDTTAVDNAGQDNAGGAGAGTPPPKTTEKPAGGSKKSLEDLERENEELRREAASYRTEKKELSKERDILKNRFDEAERAKLEEEGKFKELYEKKQKELDEERKATERKMIRSEVKAAAIAAGFIDLDLLSTIPMTEVKIDESGDVSGALEAVEKFKTNKPYLFKGSNSGSGGGDNKGKTETVATGGGKKPPETTTKPAEVDVRKLPRNERKEKLADVLNAIKK